jgi:hypothetical protein
MPYIVEMYKIVHLSKMYTFYIGICKNDNNLFMMHKIVHLAEIYNFAHFEKVGPIGTSISYLNVYLITFITHHNPPSSHTHNDPQNTLSNFPQLRTPPTFGDEDDEGGTNLNALGEPWMSINVAVQPLLSPD